MSRYRESLKGAVATSAAAYGYSLTVWTSGAITAHARGIPETIHAFLFAGGAIAAFLVIATIAYGRLANMLRAPGSPPELLGALHLPSVGIAMVLATVVAEAVHSSVAWLLVGFGATASYLLIVPIQYALASEAEELEPSARAARRSARR